MEMHASTGGIVAERTVAQCQHDRVEVRLICPECGEPFDRRSINRTELEAQAIDLPDREAMSLLGSGLLGTIGGGVPFGPASADPANPIGPPAQGTDAPAVDPMGLMNKFSPDSGSGAQPYTPESSSSSQT
jgi:hypothetical protein